MLIELARETRFRVILLGSGFSGRPEVCAGYECLRPHSNLQLVIWAIISQSRNKRVRSFRTPDLLLMLDGQRSSGRVRNLQKSHETLKMKSRTTADPKLAQLFQLTQSPQEIKLIPTRWSSGDDLIWHFWYAWWGCGYAMTTGQGSLIRGVRGIVSRWGCSDCSCSYFS